MRHTDKLRDTVQAHEFDLVVAQGNHQEQPGGNNTSEPYGEHMRDGDEHDQPGNDRGENGDREAANHRVVRHVGCFFGGIGDLGEGFLFEGAPQFLNDEVHPVCFGHEEVVVGQHARDEADVDGDHVNLPVGGDEQHVLIGPQHRAGEEPAQRILGHMNNGGAAEYFELANVLAQAQQQDNNACGGRQEPEDGEEQQRRRVPEPGEEPVHLVFSQARQHEQLREGEVKHAEYEVGGNSGCAPAHDEDQRQRKEDNEGQGGQVNVWPVAGERGYVAHTLVCGGFEEGFELTNFFDGTFLEFRLKSFGEFLTVFATRLCSSSMAR